MREFKKESYDYDLARGTILRSPRFNQFTLKDCDISDSIKKTLTYYVKDFNIYFEEGMGIYLHSNSPGSGKTTVMAIILKALMQKGYRVYCDSFIEIKKSLKEEFGKEDQPLIQILKDKDILAIDDIGSEVMSNWLEEVFKEILDYRYNLLKPTFFTSNIPIDSLPFHRRSRDRLIEISLVVPFPEKSFRRPVQFDS